MAKYCGRIGFAENVETSPSVWTEQVVERLYYGDVLRNARRSQQGEGINDNIEIDNQISIVADSYANNNFYAIRYVKWMEAAWKVSRVEVQFPRLILTLGGVYNGTTLES